MIALADDRVLVLAVVFGVWIVKEVLSTLLRLVVIIDLMILFWLCRLYRYFNE